MRSLYFLPLILAVSGCGPAPLPPIPEATAPEIKEVSLADVGLSAAAMDQTTNPCEDFYRFACGGWDKTTQIPGDQPRWMRSFSEIHKRNELELKTILEATTASNAKIGTFYGACMDEPAIEAAGWQAIKPLWDLAASLAAEEPPQLEAAVEQFHDNAIHAFFELEAVQDKKRAAQTIAQIDQAGLGLPDRDDYLSTDARKTVLRGFYRAHVARMLTLTGRFDAEAADKAAHAVLRIETEIAKVSLERVDRRDADKTYNKIDAKVWLRARRRSIGTRISNNAAMARSST